ncbi:MAG: PepSY domain-containing protein [Mariprofundaceae bacterium]|nr:PepSY domain-containing protein [Mariprofundaceae bacterium]
MIKQRSVWAMAVLAMLSASSVAGASDHERARKLLEQGEILSLSQIMKQNSSQFPGKVLDVELEEKDGLIVYEIEFLGEHGVIMEMLIDARTGRLISVKED